MIRTPQPINNPRDGTLVNAKARGYFGVGAVGGAQQNDCFDVVVREFPNAGHFDAGFDGMGVVTEPIDPFEVCFEAVGLDGILVVDLGQPFWVRDERQRYEPMNGDISVERCSSQVDAKIPLLVGNGFQFLPTALLDDPTLGSGASIYTPHSAGVADLVASGKFRDGDRKPNFAHGADPLVELPASFNVAYVAIQDGEVKCR